MKEFLAKKKYYIHEWSAMCDWFGHRGIPLKKGDLKEWCYDGHFLYFICGKNAPEELKCSEEDGAPVITCSFDSICYKCEGVMSDEESPFANLIELVGGNDEQSR